MYPFNTLLSETYYVDISQVKRSALNPEASKKYCAYIHPLHSIWGYQNGKWRMFVLALLAHV